MFKNSWINVRKTVVVLAVILQCQARSADLSSVEALDRLIETVPSGEKRLIIGDVRYPVEALLAWRDQLAASQTLKSDGSISSLSSLTENPFNAWPGGNVYYSFNANVNQAKRQYFLDAAAEWATYADLRFIQRSNEANYTEVLEDAALGGGLSDVGMIGGRQELRFGPNAWNRPTLLHEIGHTLGLLHEQSRPDRDTYVTILPANIIPGQEGNFVLIGSGLTHGTAYDFRSIMHYRKNAFSIDPDNLNTIEPKPAYTEFLDIMGDLRSHLSAGDRAGIAGLYGAGPLLSSTVTTTKDSGPGSLRQCLSYASDHSGTTVSFDIPNTDLGFNGTEWIIQPTGALPALTNHMIIDGSTQTANRTNTNIEGPEIVLNGSQLSPDDRQDGVWLSGSEVTLRDLVVQRFPWMGIRIDGLAATGNRVEGCYVGTNASGSGAEPNGIFGVSVEAGAHTNWIGGTTSTARNVISGSVTYGLAIHGSETSYNAVLGNYIGTNRFGTAGLPNAWAGIGIFGGAKNNIIGGTESGAANVLSGNTNQGITISGEGTNSNVVQGNLIGTNAAGNAALPNVWAGISIYGGAQFNVIGGASNLSRNVLSGNSNQGITISGTNTSANRVEGNLIGLDASGTAIVSNAWSGVELFSGAQDNHIGGIALGAGNIISGNANHGVSLNGSATLNNFVKGNTIGLTLTGGSAGNGWSGIGVFEASNNEIGGSEAGSANIITESQDAGIVLYSGIQNRISGNSLYNNDRSLSAWQSIDIGANGHSVNDALDADSGPNLRQNAPILALAQLSVTGTPAIAFTRVDGTLSSTPGETFRIEFFASATGHVSGFGEGQYFLGALMGLTTNGSGDVSFTNHSLASPIAAGWVLTATATDSLGNTSEFSNAIVVSTITDTDGDGMPNAYESSNELSTSLNDAELDLDGDGIPNRIEMRLGTDPASFSSGLSLDLAPSNADIRIQFNTIPGKLYRLRASETLGAGARWRVLRNASIANGDNTVFLDEEAGALPRRFYQIELLP